MARNIRLVRCDTFRAENICNIDTVIVLSTVTLIYSTIQWINIQLCYTKTYSREHVLLPLLPHSPLFNISSHKKSRPFDGVKLSESKHRLPFLMLPAYSPGRDTELVITSLHLSLPGAGILKIK